MASEEMEQLVRREYKDGFVTDIESDTLPPGRLAAMVSLPCFGLRAACGEALRRRDICLSALSPARLSVAARRLQR